MPATMSNLLPYLEQEERIVHVDQLPPMRFNEEAWFLVQDEGWMYRSTPNYKKDKSDEEIVNNLYQDLHKLPGDIVLKVIAKAFDLDVENKEVARYIYETTCKVGIKE